MLNANQVAGILQQVKYKDWEFQLTWDECEVSRVANRYLQVVFSAPYEPQMKGEIVKYALQSGRKWRLSPCMTPSEIVQTAFLACLTAEEHEVRESFLYKGQPVYGPHFDVERLVELCLDEASREVRS